MTHQTHETPVGLARLHDHDTMHAEVLHRVMHLQGSRTLVAHLLELGIVLHSVIVGIGLGAITDSFQEVGDGNGDAKLL